MYGSLLAAWVGCTDLPKEPRNHACDVELEILPGDSVVPIPVTGAATAGWKKTAPLLNGGEIQRNKGGTLKIYDLDPGMEVTLFLSYALTGEGPCNLWHGLCMTLLSPTVYASTVAPDHDAADTAAAQPGDVAVEFTFLPEDFQVATTLALQAGIYDPETGEAALSEAVYRHVSVPATNAATDFTDVNIIATLGPVQTSGNTHAGGMMFFDYNNDYWTDIFVANGSGLTNYLWRNNGDGTFTPQHFLVQKPDPTAECAAARWADVDNDGDLDIFTPVDNGQQMDSSVSQPFEGGPNYLWINNNGVFVESAELSGLVDPRGWRNVDASFGDYDRDGCIDVYLVNWAMANLPAGDNTDRLMHGNCDGTFEDVTPFFDLDPFGRDGLVAFFWDADFDLYPELYVGNNSDIKAPPDWDPDGYYYKNLDGVAFLDWTDTTPGLMGHDWASMGADIGDIDMDGDWEIYIQDVWELPPVPRGNTLYVGSPDGKLTTNVCQEYGVCAGHNSWGANFADFNRDMWTDLWVGTSQNTDDEIMYINRADGTGHMDKHEIAGWGSHRTRAGSIADYDGDGDVDVFIWDTEGPSRLYRQESRDTNRWVEFRLFGTRSNAAAIGAVVRVTAGGYTQMRRVSGSDSAHSQQDIILHFGMAQEKEAVVEVTWPSGIVQTFPSVTTNDLVFIDEDLGVLEESLTFTEATWHWVSSTLEVTAKSRFGGRTTLNVETLGSLVYDSAAVEHTATFEGLEAAPATVTVTSARGGSWPIVVVVAP